MALVKILEFEEGYHPNPYLCSEGYLTVGFGTRMSSQQDVDPEPFNHFYVNRDAAMSLMLDDIDDVRSSVVSYIAEHEIELSPEREAILISMGYQMGVRGLFNFKNMWKSIKEGNWEEAAEHALDSRWAKRNSPMRAIRHAEVLRTGELWVYEGTLD